MRKLLVLALVLLCSQLTGGFTFPTNSTGTVVGGGSGGSAAQWYCLNLNDNTIVSTAGSEDVTSPINFIPSQAGAVAFANREQVTFFPPGQGMAWNITGMSVTVISSPLVAGEDCMVSLIHAATNNGADNVALQIGAGPGATLGNDTGGACEASVLGADATNVDDLGDSCIQTLTTPLVATAGMGLRFRFGDEDGGGANTCTSFQSTALCFLAQAL